MRNVQLNQWFAVGFMAAGLGLGGCVGAGSDETDQSMAGAASPEQTAEDGRVLEVMETLGFDPAKVTLDGDTVRVDADEVFERRAVLAGDYGYLRKQDAEDHDKGYRFSGTLVSHPEDLKLAPLAVPSNLMWGVSWAGTMWSQGSNGRVNMKTTNSGSGGWIQILMVDWNNWSGTPCGSDAQACVASFPKGGYPPSLIYVKSKPFANCAWTQFTFAAVLIHELGHALGLVHPSPTQGTLIPGTAACQPAWDGNCYIGSPGYDTIMKPTSFDSSCNLHDALDLYTRNDDMASIRALYP